MSAFQFKPEKTVKEITVVDLKKMMDDKVDFQLIDVREPFEYELVNIGGELVPQGQILEYINNIRQDVKVVFQCRSGVRSANVIRLLEDKAGFENLYNLKGGILAWSDQVDPSKPKY